MKNCPYCDGILQDDSATFCASCGMAWSAEDEANIQASGEQETPQDQQAPEEPPRPEEAVDAPPEPEPAPEAPVGGGAPPPPPPQPEPTPEPAETGREPQADAGQQSQEQPQYQQAPPEQQGQYQAPPQEQQYQQPPEQREQYQEQPQQQYQQPQDDGKRLCLQCGRQIPVDYKICPHCGRRAVTEPPPPPRPQQRPAPPPRPMGPPPPRGKVGGGAMGGAIVGAIMALIGSFILYYTTSNFGGTAFVGVQDITQGNYVYAWLIPVFAVLVMIMAPVAYGIQSRGAAMTAMVFGLLVMLIAILLPVHIALDTGGSIVDGFYQSSTGFTMIYMGGFMAIFGGISAMGGAASLGGAIKRASPPRVYPQQRYR